MTVFAGRAAFSARTGRGVDFVTIDGGEGGTGAAPLAFSDHVAMPFKLAISRVYPCFARAGIAEDVVFIGAGRLGFPDAGLHALALGCDMVNVGREAMLAIGCIQAQKCHTDTCPTGVATQNAWLAHGLDPALKSVRAANYVSTLRRDLLKVAEACGVEHPGLIDTGSAAGLDGSIAKAYEGKEGWVGYYWAPTALLGKYEMVKLEHGVPNDMAEWKRCNTVATCPDPKPNEWPRVSVQTLVFWTKTGDPYEVNTSPVEAP